MSSKKSRKLPKEVDDATAEPPSNVGSYEIELLRQQLFQVQMQNAQLQQYMLLQQQQQQQHHVLQNPTVIVQCPNSSHHNPHYKNLFLGGTISTDDWQKALIEKLKGQSVCIFNPRREDWKQIQDVLNRPSHSAKDETFLAAANSQLSWELDSLEKSNLYVFYFAWDQQMSSKSYLQLGRATSTGKPIFICVHPRNKEKRTIYEFIRSTVGNSYITTNIDKLSGKLLNWIVTGQMPESHSQGSFSDDALSTVGS